MQLPNSFLTKLKPIVALGLLALLALVLILNAASTKTPPQSRQTKAAGTRSVDLSFAGEADLPLTASSVYSIAVKIDRNADGTTPKIASARITFAYPTPLLTFKEIIYNSAVGFKRSELGGDGIVTVDGTQSIAVVADAVRDSSGYLSSQPNSFLMATVSFTVNPGLTSGSTGSFIYKTADIAGENGSLTVDKTGANTQLNKTISAGGAGAGNMWLTIKLRLQGVVKPPKTATQLTFKVLVNRADNTSEAAFDSVNFTVDGAAAWTGKLSKALLPADDYYLIIKGPKHLARKICKNSPEDLSGQPYHCAGPAISLKAGDNSIDLSSIYLFAGDFAKQESDTSTKAVAGQDGLANSADYGVVAEIIDNTESVSADLKAMSDLNYDGFVDAQDYSLIYETWKNGFNQDEN